MKPSKMRKIQREIVKSHNTKRAEISRITNAQQKAWASYRFFLSMNKGAKA